MKIKPIYILAFVITLAVITGVILILNSEDETEELAGTVASTDFTPQFLPLINQLRCSNGLQPVVINPLLTQAAIRHNQDMISNNRFDHTGSDGSSPSSRIETAGYDWEATAENIAQSQNTVDEVFQSWLNSPEHKANMLKANMQEIGLAYGTDANGKPYWTLNLGKTFDGVTVPSC